MNAGFEARLRLAQADTTPEDTLAKLAIDPDSEIRQSVARNPNTSTETLLKLGKEFPDEVTENPIFLLLLLENSESYFVRLSLARSITTDATTLSQLFEATNNGSIWCAIAENPNSPVELLEKFVREHQNVDYEKDQSAHELDIYRILDTIAQDPNSPESLLQAVAHYGTESAVKFLFRNPNLYPSVLEELASIKSIRYYRDCFQEILAHPNVSQTAIAIVNAKQGMRGIQPEVLDMLVNHQSEHVRSSIISHPELTREQLLKLAETPSLQWEILDILPNLPAIVIENIAEDTFERMLSSAFSQVDYEILFWITRHPNTSRTLLESFALNQPHRLYHLLGEGKFVVFRGAVARNSSSSIEILKRLHHDVNAEVRAAAQQALKTRRLDG